MKVLITGADGQLGRALQRSVPRKAELTALNRRQLDITQPSSVETVCKVAPDLIVNAAAYTAVDKAEEERASAYAVNANGAEHMAQAAQRLGSRLVHISTDFVFDGTQGRPYRPEDAANPLNVYGASKLAGERAVQTACPEALILRTAWLYSSEGHNFVLTMLRLMRERETLQVVDDQIGTPTLADSLANAVWRAVDTGLTGVHHWTDSGVASWYDFAVAVHELALRHCVFSRPVRIEPIGTEAFPTPARRPSNSVLDKRAIYSLLGSAPHWTLALNTLSCWK